ncbi:neuralized-like protein 4 [Ischnura elegans]|uniref:neuralized-like protein 4 n=1 Tax=Ischnura elegans TaxID=197161 RepID=UPI001ED8B0A6|nr:neuralized-like protein 4 [Ischnura elegans]
MIAHFVLLLLCSAIVGGEEQQRAEEAGVCAGDNAFWVSFHRRPGSEGEWTVEAKRVDVEGRKQGRLEVEAWQGSVGCGGSGGRTAAHVRVIVREMPENGSGEATAEKDDRLKFHPRHGKNAVILNDGRSAQKLDLDDTLNAVLFTHRALKDGELFEVRLDKRVVKQNHCFALGVMTHSPDDVTILPSMHQHKNGTWVYHNSAIYGSARELAKYGTDLNKIQARERLGVMRKEDGSIHYFLNGVDLGRAMANIPGPVYGIFELWYDAVKGTIVY